MDRTKTGSRSQIVDSPELIQAADMLKALLKEGEKAAWKTGDREPRAFADCHRIDLLKAIQQLKAHSAQPVPPDEAALLSRLDQALGEHSPIALTSRRGPEGTLVIFTLALKELTSLLDVLEHVLKGPEAVKASAKVMLQFTEEFAKGMEAWGKTLGTAPDEKKPWCYHH